LYIYICTHNVCRKRERERERESVYVDGVVCHIVGGRFFEFIYKYVYTYIKKEREGESLYIDYE